MIKYFIKYKVADYNKLPRSIKAELLQRKEDSGLYVFAEEDIDQVNLTTLKQDFFNQTNPLELTYVLNFFNALYNTNIDLGKSADDVSSVLDKIVQVYLLDWCKKCNLSHVVMPAGKLTTKIVDWWKQTFCSETISQPKGLKKQLQGINTSDCIRLSMYTLTPLTGIDWFLYYYGPPKSRKYKSAILMPQETLKKDFAQLQKEQEFFGHLFVGNLYYYEIATIDENSSYYNNDIEQIPPQLFVPGDILKQDIITVSDMPTINDMKKIFKKNIPGISSVKQIYLKEE